jgi:hypothetical protein
MWTSYHLHSQRIDSQHTDSQCTASSSTHRHCYITNITATSTTTTG